MRPVARSGIRSVRGGTIRRAGVGVRVDLDHMQWPAPQATGTDERFVWPKSLLTFLSPPG
jgi:hypothetical protein